MSEISQTAFAIKMGISKSAVSQLVAQEKLPHNGKKIIMPNAERAYHLLKSGLGSTATQHYDTPEKPNNDLTTEDVAVIKDDGKKLLKAKAEKETHLAELNKLKVLKEQGKLIEVDEVVNQCNKAMEIVRSELLNLPSRVAMVLEGKTAHEIQLKLEDVLNHAMKSLFDLGSLYQEDSGKPENLS